MDEIYEFLNGRFWIWNGLPGVFRFEVIPTKRRTIKNFLHEKTDEAKESEVYQKYKRELGDDWVSDLTNELETVCDIAHQLGFVSQEG